MNGCDDLTSAHTSAAKGKGVPGKSRKPAPTDEARGSAAFRDLGHELNELCSLICDGDQLPGPREFDHMANAVEVSLTQNVETASEEHRRGFTRDLAELISLSFDGCGVEGGWWGKGAGRGQIKVLADDAPVKPQAIPPSATSIDLALKILHEHFEQLAALSFALENRLADECERVKDGGPLIDWRLAQVLNDKLSSTRVQREVACLLGRETPGQEP